MFISAMWFLAMAILITVTSPALQSAGWRVRQWPAARRRQRTPTSHDHAVRYFAALVEFVRSLYP